MYTVQPGRFPITSAQGHKYTMVAVELDGNYIDAIPMKSRTAKELTEAYKKIYARWKATGVICPNWHVLDNKAPAKFLEAIRENGCRVEKHQQICTSKTLPSKQSKHTKAISLQLWLAYQMTFQSTNGTS